MKRTVKRWIEAFKEYRPPKVVCLLYFMFPILVCILRNVLLDNDTWWLINSGRYVLEHKIPTIEPFTMHQGLDFVMQQWLSCVIFAKIYDIGGTVLLGIFVSLILSLFMYLFYKLCMLISENKFYLSILLTMVTSSILSLYYMVARPQIFSYIIYILFFLCLESYIKKKNWKYLLFIPLLSILEVNLHGATWWMLPCFMIPYLIDGFRFSLLGFKSENYDVKPLLLAFLSLIISALLNPYGIKTLQYLLLAYGNFYLHNRIQEMQAPSIKEAMGMLIYFTIFLVIGIYYFKKEKSIKVRYFCLFLGVTFLSLSAYRNYSLFMIAAFFPLASYLGEYFKTYKVPPNLPFKKYKRLYALVICLFLLFFSFLFMVFKEYKSDHKLDGAISYLKKIPKERLILYNNFNDGAYLEFCGFKTYFDPRPEVFDIKSNHKKDILTEYFDLQSGRSDMKKFLASYSFTHILVGKNDILYHNIASFEKYEVAYQDKNYKIYVPKKEN